MRLRLVNTGRDAARRVPAGVHDGRPADARHRRPSSSSRTSGCHVVAPPPTARARARCGVGARRWRAGTAPVTPTTGRPAPTSSSPTASTVPVRTAPTGRVGRRPGRRPPPLRLATDGPADRGGVGARPPRGSGGCTPTTLAGAVDGRRRRRRRGRSTSALGAEEFTIDRRRPRCGGRRPARRRRCSGRSPRSAGSAARRRSGRRATRRRTTGGACTSTWPGSSSRPTTSTG